MAFVKVNSRAIINIEESPFHYRDISEEMKILSNITVEKSGGQIKYLALQEQNFEEKDPAQLNDFYI